jgi:predicted Zn-dependent protease
MRAARVLLQVARIFGSLGHARRATALAQRALAIDARAARLSALQPVAVAVGRPIVPVICAAAELRAKDGRLEEARALLRLAVDADGLRVAAVRRLAELEQHMGDEAAARDVLDRLARGLLRFGRMHEFATVAEHYLTLSPHDPFILQALAHAHLRAGRARAALPRLQLLARLDPSDAGTLLELAEVHAGLRHRKAGLVALARWAWLRSRDGGTLDQVRAQLERAAKWWPTDEGWRDGVFALAVRGPRQTKISIGDVDLVLQSAEPPPPPPARLSA